MQLFAPVYYEKFKCRADRCTHSCCVGWEIDVDGLTLSRYRSAEGEVGELLRRGLVLDGEGAHFALDVDGKCPHLTENGLCEIISQCGEGYLCEICREHPRFYNWQGDRMECGLGASCEEAARLILETADYVTLLPVETMDEAPDEPWVFAPYREREAAFALLNDPSRPYGERLKEIAKKYGVSLPVEGDMRVLLDALEYLEPSHKAILMQAVGFGDTVAERPLVCERFLAYLIYRHTGSAESYGEFCRAVGLALAIERLFRALLCDGMSPVSAAVMLSEELEYSEDNTQAICAAVAKASPT